MTEIICASIAGLCTIICAIIGGVSAKYKKKADRRAELRQRESLLSLKLMDATLKLSSVTAIAVTGSGKLNGNVEEARQAAEKVGEEYADFMRSVTAFEVGK